MTDDVPRVEPRRAAPPWRAVLYGAAAAGCLAVLLYGANLTVNFSSGRDARFRDQQGGRIVTVALVALAVVAAGWLASRRLPAATALLAPVVAVACAGYAATVRDDARDRVRDEVALLDALPVPPGARLESSREQPGEQQAVRMWALPGTLAEQCPVMLRGLREWTLGHPLVAESTPEDTAGHVCSWRANRGPYVGYLAVQRRAGQPLLLVFEVSSR